jgi:hypothetical protein
VIIVDDRLARIVLSGHHAAALHHGAGIALTERNVGRRWPGLFEELGLTLTVV